MPSDENTLPKKLYRNYFQFPGAQINLVLTKIDHSDHIQIEFSLGKHDYSFILVYKIGADFDPIYKGMLIRSQDELYQENYWP